MRRWPSPSTTARNFDALADCLLDVVDDTILLWDGWGPLARDDPQAFSVALSVLGTRVNAEREGAFAVLLRGDGPEPAGVHQPRLTASIEQPRPGSLDRPASDHCAG